jgi:hypothetical protein
MEILFRLNSNPAHRYVSRVTFWRRYSAEGTTDGYSRVSANTELSRHSRASLQAEGVAPAKPRWLLVQVNVDGFPQRSAPCLTRIHCRIVRYQILQRNSWKMKKLFPSLNFHTRFLHTLIDARSHVRKNNKILNLPADLWKIHFFFPELNFHTLFTKKWSVTFNQTTHETTFLLQPTKNNQTNPTTSSTTPHSTAHRSNGSHDYFGKGC